MSLMVKIEQRLLRGFISCQSADGTMPILQNVTFIMR